MALPALPSLEDVRQVIRLDEATGLLYWLPRPRNYFTVDREFKRWNNRYAGVEALNFITPQGYRRGIILGRHTLAHHVVFALTYGRWPESDMDHINGIRSDNRPENLREVSCAINNRNQKRFKNNSSGRTGVVFRGGAWRARIGAAGATTLGSFPTFEEAVAAREAAEVELGYHANHGRAA